MKEKSQATRLDDVLRLTHLTETDRIVRRLQEMLDDGFRLDDAVGDGEVMAPSLFRVLYGATGNARVLAEMLRLGANPNVVRADTGQTPLITASEIGRVDLMQVLLEGGASTEKEDNAGQTALHMAAWHLNLEAISLLLRHGANRQHRDHANRMAVDKAWLGKSEGEGQPILLIGWSPASQAAHDAHIAARAAEVVALLNGTGV